MDMGRRVFAVVRSAVVSTVFMSLWLYFLPRWFGGRTAFADPRPAGYAVMAVGLAVGVWCVFEFAWRGLGTPAPFDPPSRLVITGPYRFVRNPMYVGGGIAMIGEAIAFPNVTLFMLALLVVQFIAVSVLIRVIEEPSLRRMFGGDFEHYCANVRRWIPRLTPFDMPKAPAVE